MDDAGYLQNIAPDQQLPYLDCRIPKEGKLEEEDYSRLNLQSIFSLPSRSMRELVSMSPFEHIYFPYIGHYVFSPPLPEDLLRNSIISFHDIYNINTLYLSLMSIDEDEAQAEAENYDYISPLFFYDDHKYIRNKIAGVEYDKAYRMKGNAGGYKYYYRMNIPLNIDSLDKDPLWSNGEFMFGAAEYYHNFFQYMAQHRPEQLLDINSEEFQAYKQAELDKTEDYDEYFRKRVANELERVDRFADKYENVKRVRYTLNRVDKKNEAIEKLEQNLKLTVYLDKTYKRVIEIPFKGLNFLELFNIIPEIQEKKKNFISHDYIKLQNIWNFYNEDYNRLYGFLFIKESESISKTYTKYVPVKVRLGKRDPFFSLFSFSAKNRLGNSFYFFRKYKELPLPYYCQNGFYDLPIRVMRFIDLSEYQMRLIFVHKPHLSAFLAGNESILKIDTQRFRVNINNYNYE